MKKTFAFGGALLVAQISLLALAVSQERTWGGTQLDEGSGVATAPDGSVYVTGSTLSFGVGDRDAFLLKYDAVGTLLWQRTYGTASSEPGFRADEFGLDVATSGDGSAIYVTGQFGNGSVFVAKFNAAGDLVWDRTWGDNGNFSRGVAVASDGSVYVTGGTSTFSVGQGDVFVFKLTPDGLLAWDMTWGDTGHDSGHAIAINTAGEVYVAGETNSFVANDAFLFKLTPAGTLLWERDWGTLDRDGFPGLTAATGVATAPDGSVYITGNASDIGELKNIVLVKFNPNGDVIWERIGGPGFGGGSDVAVAGDGQVFVTGSILVESRDVPDAFGSHLFVAQFSPAGKKGKAIEWGGANHESALGDAIAIAADGSVAVAGFAQNPPYASRGISNSARAVDAFVQAASGTVTDPPAALNAAPGGQVTEPAGSETFGGGEFDAVFLRLQR
jgi:uncharacterized delta-60 repeat protein